MDRPKFKRMPRHIGVIPDGNRRWAVGHGLGKQDGYAQGLDPGLELYELCVAAGVKELTFYGFTQDNTKRPSIQTLAFQRACVDAVEMLSKRDAALLVLGNTKSPMFPKDLLPYANQRITFGTGIIKVNFLVNYGWKWDLSHGAQGLEHLASSDISRVDLIIRWGGRRRLSGFLPVQSIYADFFVVDDYWPDFRPEHFYDAIQWYETQDVTLGG